MNEHLRENLKKETSQKQKRRQFLISELTKTNFSSKMSKIFADIAQSISKASEEILKSKKLSRDLSQRSKLSSERKTKNLPSPRNASQLFTPGNKFFFKLTSPKEEKSVQSSVDKTKIKEKFLATTNEKKIKKLNIKHENSSENFRKNAKLNSCRSEILSKTIIYRKKRFTVQYNPKWYKKAGVLPPGETDAKIITEKSYQRSLISNEISVLLDNISKFKIYTFSEVSSLVHTDSAIQNFVSKLNRLIEEICGLLLKISNIILLDFEKFVQNPIYMPVLPSKMKEGELVTDEVQAFDENLLIFNDCEKFISSAYEIYLLLSSQVETYIIPYNDMIQLRFFLSQARYDVSSLIFTSKSYITTATNDSVMYEKYKIEMRKYEKTQGNFARSREMKDMNERMRERLRIKINEETEKNRRLENILNFQNKDKDFEEKKRKIMMKKRKFFNLDSKMMNKMMNYMNPEMKKKVIGEKILNMFKEKKSDKKRVMQAGGTIIN